MKYIFTEVGGKLNIELNNSLGQYQNESYSYESASVQLNDIYIDIYNRQVFQKRFELFNIDSIGGTVPTTINEAYDLILGLLQQGSGGTSLYLGQYLSQLAFETAHPTGVEGNFAWVLDPTESFYIYAIWDVVNAIWVYDYRTQATIDEIAYLGTLIGNVPHLIATTTGNNTTSDIIVADDLNPPVPATDLIATYIKKSEIWLYKTVAGVTTALRLLSNGFRFGTNAQTLTVSAEAQTAQNTQTFQNKSGVIALTSDIPVIGNWVDYSATSTIVGWSSFTNKSIKILKISSKIIFVKYTILGISNSPNASFTVSDNALDDTTQFGTVSRAYSNNVYSVGMSYIVNGSNVLQCFKDPQGNNWSATSERTIVGQMFIKIG